MNRDDLRRALDDLEADGTLEATVRTRVEARLEIELPVERDRGSLLAGIVVTVGVLLIATGIVHFIATHWDDIPKFVKLGGIVAALLGFHHFGYRLAEEPGRWPRAGTALTAGGVLLFGAALALVSQIYHLESTPNGILLWWGLNLPFVLLTRSRVVLSIVAALFSIWAIWQTIDWLDARDLDRDLHVLVAFATLAAAYAALFAGFAGLAGGERRAWPEAVPWLRSLAIPAAFLSLYVLSFHDVIDADDVLRPALLGPALALGLAAGLVLAAATVRARAGADAAEGAAFLLLGGVIVAVVRFAPGTTWIWLNLVLFVGLLLLVARGARRGVSEYVNLGLAGIFVLVMTRYFELLAEKIEHAFLAFLGAGVVLLGVGYVLEKKRRSLLARAREVR